MTSARPRGSCARSWLRPEIHVELHRRGLVDVTLRCNRASTNEAIHVNLPLVTPDDVLRGVLQAEIEIAARISSRDAASLTTSDAVRALRAYGLKCSQSAPLVEAQISIPEPELKHILAELCARYGAGLEKKPRPRLLTIMAPRAFIDNALQPVLQGMLDVVIASRHEQTRRLVAELRASAP